MAAVGVDADLKVVFKTGGTGILQSLAITATVDCGASWRGRPEESGVVGQWPGGGVKEAAVEAAVEPAVAAMLVVSSGDQGFSLVAPCSARPDPTTTQVLAGLCGT